MKENGKMINEMVSVFIVGLMEGDLRESTPMTKDEEVYSYGQRAPYMMGNTVKVVGMGKFF
jgi:hypothetical protein